MEPTECPCGGAFVFDPTVEGETCGGLHLIGWLICSSCGESCVTKRGRVAGGKWTVATSGRSMVADGVKLRAEAEKGAEPQRVLERISRLPDLENALLAIARGDANAADIAKRALGGGS